MFSCEGAAGGSLEVAFEVGGAGGVVEGQGGFDGPGAEIGGVDLSAPLPSYQMDEIRRALAENCVIFFRDQQLEPAAPRHGPRAPGPIRSPRERAR